jgi:hypothetical protein
MIILVSNVPGHVIGGNDQITIGQKFSLGKITISRKHTHPRTWYSTWCEINVTFVVVVVTLMTTRWGRRRRIRQRGGV